MRRRRKKNSSDTKPKKTRWDSLRKVLAKNRDIIYLIISTITIFLSIYLSNVKTEPKAEPRLEIDRPSPLVLV